MPRRLQANPCRTRMRIRCAIAWPPFRACIQDPVVPKRLLSLQIWQRRFQHLPIQEKDTQRCLARLREGIHEDDHPGTQDLLAARRTRLGNWLQAMRWRIVSDRHHIRYIAGCLGCLWYARRLRLRFTHRWKVCASSRERPLSGPSACGNAAFLLPGLSSPTLSFLDGRLQILLFLSHGN